jgi:P27 family predicted phage terminase small subunit
MGKRGPKPTPTALRELHGNPDKRPEAADEPEPEIASVDAPEHLNEIARAEWERLAPELIRLRLLTVVDLGLLAAWCVAWADFCAAEKSLANGVVVEGKGGQDVRSPWFIVKYKAIEAMVKISDRMGFSPSARVGLASAAPELPDASEPAGRRVKGGRSLAGFLSQKPDNLN